MEENLPERKENRHLIVKSYTKIPLRYALNHGGNLRPVGRMWPSQRFYAAGHMISKLANARRVIFSATEIHTLYII
jgi:hypothetical protein